MLELLSFSYKQYKIKIINEQHTQFYRSLFRQSWTRFCNKNIHLTENNKKHKEIKKTIIEQNLDKIKHTKIREKWITLRNSST